MALDFVPGSSEHIVVGNNSFPSGTAQRTIAFWFSADSFGTIADQVAIGYLPDGGPGASLDIAAEDNGVSVAFNGHRLIIDKSVLSTGTWYHFALVIPSGATQTDDALLYRDGSLKTASDEGGSAQTLNTGTPDMLIGARNTAGTPDRHFDGKLAEVAIWDTDIGAAKIAGLGEGLSPYIYPEGLLLYMPLWNTSYQTVDLIAAQSTSVNGTPTNSAHPRVIYPSKSKKIYTEVSGYKIPSASNIEADIDEVDDNSFTTASVSPSADTLILAAITSRTGISTDPNTPTLSGNGLTWVEIASIVWDTTSSSRKRTTLFRAMGSSPSTGAITIDFDGQTQTECLWAIDEISNADTSGSNGSGAIVKSVTDKDESASSSSFSVDMTSFSSSKHFPYVVLANDRGDFGTPLTAEEELSQLQKTNQSQVTQWINNNLTNTGWDGPGIPGAHGGVAVEIKPALVAGASTAIRDLIMPGMIPFARA